jgi:hypothetical protein
MRVSCLFGSLWLCSVGLAQSSSLQLDISPRIVGRTLSDGQVTVIQVAPRFATAIRMHEPVNSVVLGDPAAFSAEHSEREPNIVFVKPITLKAASTNVVITTSGGHQATVLLVSRGEEKSAERAGVDLLLRYKPAGRFLIEQSELPAATISETASVEATQASTQSRAVLSDDRDSSALDQLLERQRKAPLPTLYGTKPDISDPGKELVKTGVGEVIDQGRQVVVLFSVVNPQQHSIELMPPQVQLGGKVRTGRIFRGSKWTSAEQFPISDYRMSRRRIGPGERADGVVVFNRPPFKQSNETLFLQVAETGAVDRPALAPIGFGISSYEFREEGSNGTRKAN